MGRLLCFFGAHNRYDPQEWEKGARGARRMVPLENGWTAEERQCPRCGKWLRTGYMTNGKFEVY